MQDMQRRKMNTKLPTVCTFIVIMSLGCLGHDMQRSTLTGDTCTTARTSVNRGNRAGVLLLGIQVKPDLLPEIQPVCKHHHSVTCVMIVFLMAMPAICACSSWLVAWSSSGRALRDASFMSSLHSTNSVSCSTGSQPGPLMLPSTTAPTQSGDGETQWYQWYTPVAVYHLEST